MPQPAKCKSSPDRHMRQTRYDFIALAVRYVKNAIESGEGCLHEAFWNVVKYYDKYYVKRLGKKKNTIQLAYYYYYIDCERF